MRFVPPPHLPAPHQHLGARHIFRTKRLALYLIAAAMLLYMMISSASM